MGNSKMKTVGVIGLGYVGLPTAIGFHDAGFGRGGRDVPAFGAGRRDDVVHVGVAGGVFPGHDHVNGSLGHVNAPDLEAGVVEADGCG